MTEEEVETVARATATAVIAEQKRLHNAEADEVVLKTISTILTSFGIEEEDRKELRADFNFLRRLRTSSDQIQRVGIGTVVTVLFTGVVGIIWLGIKTLMGITR